MLLNSDNVYFASSLIAKPIRDRIYHKMNVFNIANKKGVEHIVTNLTLSIVDLVVQIIKRTVKIGAK